MGTNSPGTLPSYDRTDKVWVSQDGRRTPIVEMDDAHLANAIRHCEEMFARKRSDLNSVLSMFTPIIKDTLIGDFYEHVMDQEIEQLMPGYQSLLREAMRRFVIEHATKFLTEEEKAERQKHKALTRARTQNKP